MCEVFFLYDFSICLLRVRILWLMSLATMPAATGRVVRSRQVRDGKRAERGCDSRLRVRDCFLHGWQRPSPDMLERDVLATRSWLRS